MSPKQWWLVHFQTWYISVIVVTNKVYDNMLPQTQRGPEDMNRHIDATTNTVCFPHTHTPCGRGGLASASSYHIPFSLPFWTLSQQAFYLNVPWFPLILFTPSLHYLSSTHTVEQGTKHEGYWFHCLCKKFLISLLHPALCLVCCLFTQKWEPAVRQNVR